MASPRDQYLDLCPLQFGENSLNIILYADDTAIYYAHNRLEVLEKQLAVGMKKLCDWCNLNKLTFNFQKTK